MAHEKDQAPTQDQRRDATRFVVKEEAKKRSQEHGLSVHPMPKR